MKKFDLCVIGAGPSGYAAAMRAIDFGKSVLLVEKDKIGGAGIHQGALWSKTWWEVSKEAMKINERKDSLNISNTDYRFGKIKKEVDSVVKEREKLLTRHIDNLNTRLGKNLFEFIKGTAKVTDTNKVEIKTNKEVIEIQAENIVLATGSKPRKLPFLPIDEKVVFTSDGLNNLERFPESMVIMGAGVIGCEFATIFANFGNTKVHLIDKGDRILPFEDEDVVEIIENKLEQKGVFIHRNSRLVEMNIVDGEVDYVLEYKDGKKETFHVEKALVSIGRVSQIDGVCDDCLELECDSRGIKDDETRTNIPNVYAIGDITADISLVNVGELEGRHAVEKMFLKEVKPLVYKNISTIMFLDPVVAGVGMNEIQAQKAELEYKVVKVDYSLITRSNAMRKNNGFIKILVTNDDELKILGMRVIGSHASSSIQAVALLISQDRSIKELAELIHPHPSIIEGVQECGRLLLGTSLFKPSVLNDAMSCRVWKDGKYENIVF